MKATHQVTITIDVNVPTDDKGIADDLDAHEWAMRAACRVANGRKSFKFGEKGIVGAEWRVTRVAPYEIKGEQA